MKRYLVAIIVFSLFMGVPVVLAARHDITCGGNVTSGNYTIGDDGTAHISVALLNSTSLSSERVMFNATINISTNSTTLGAATLTDLNYTLGDEWAYNSVSDINLWNSTFDLIQSANATQSDGNYLEVWFNNTNLAANANTYGAIMNSTIYNTTFYITFILESPDNKKATTQTSSKLEYTDKVRYPGPSDLDITSVTFTHQPSGWADVEAVKTVTWNGTTLSRGTGTNTYTLSTDGVRVNTASTLLHDTNNTLNITWTKPETGHGGTGAGRTRPTAVPTYPTRPAPTFTGVIQAIVNFFRMLFGLK